MASNYQAAKPYIKTIEGGYCVGAECGNAASGETYNGIDRRYHPEWPGFKLIDDYKRAYGRPPKNFRFTGTLGALIDNEVAKFYQQYWINHGLQNLNNQTLANLVFAFVVIQEYAAIKVINNVAVSLGATSTSIYRITPQAGAAIERNISRGYTAVRNAIINRYQQLSNSDSLIRNRVNIFPNTIAPSLSSPAIQSSTSGGVLGWLLALLGASKL